MRFVRSQQLFEGLRVFKLFNNPYKERGPQRLQGSLRGGRYRCHIWKYKSTVNQYNYICHTHE